MGMSFTMIAKDDRKDKDRVVAATDKIAEALQALIRINYDNEQQAARNIADATILLKLAANELAQA